MHIGVFGLIQDEKGKVLLVQDATREQKWTLPGGGPEFQELIPDTLIREIKEETSLTVTVGKLLGVFSQQKEPGIVFLFQANVIEGTPKTDGKETQNIDFFSLEEIMEMRELIKPAQLSMVHQVLNTEESKFPIYNSFPKP
jgi:ADP-ribose pyrophosphatase YjhB (NUDIX family)